MKQRVTREEVKERLVTDAYFQKGRSALKTRQTILTILAWLMVLVPFVWLAIPLTLRIWRIGSPFGHIWKKQ